MFYNRVAMYSMLKTLVAAALLVCVLAIFIAPSIDLPETALRYRQIYAAILQSIGTLLLLALLAYPLLLRGDLPSLASLPSDRMSSHCQFLC